MVKKIYKNKISFKHKNYIRKNKNELSDEKKGYNIEILEKSKESIKNIDDIKTGDKKNLVGINNGKTSNYSSNTISIDEPIEHIINKKANKNDKNIIEIKKKNDKENYINLIRKFKHKIRDVNIKSILSFLLGEYTETNLMNKLLEILSLKKIKIIYHSLMTLYNFYCNKDKAIASGVLMCLSLIQD